MPVHFLAAVAWTLAAIAQPVQVHAQRRALSPKVHLSRPLLPALHNAHTVHVGLPTVQVVQVVQGLHGGSQGAPSAVVGVAVAPVLQVCFVHVTEQRKLWCIWFMCGRL